MSVLVAMETPLSLFPAANKNTLEMVQYGVEGSSTFLECQARSPHALIKWHLQRDNSERRKEVTHCVFITEAPYRSVSIVFVAGLLKIHIYKNVNSPNMSDHSLLGVAQYFISLEKMNWRFNAV